MIDVRLTVGPNYLVRPRLLNKLPATGGHVVWLEAPYGYGKSILAGQWAQQLEPAGWRVVWVSLAGRPSARAALAQARGLPTTAPWGALLDDLWSEPTVIILEELNGTEELEPLLHAPAGLLLLASRQHLSYPALLRHVTAGTLTHITATHLAFTQREAAAIFGTRAGARRAWEATNGWPLPLHFAALQGELPPRTSLVEGVKQSVSPAAWQEVLLLAAVPELPNKAATSVTAALAKEGFAQQLTGAYRLHELIAHGVFEAYGNDVRAQLRNAASRLPPAVRGAAFERAHDYEALAAHLSGPDGHVTQENAADYLRWYALTTGSSLITECRVAEAAFHLTRFTDAIPAAQQLVTNVRAPVVARARLATTAVWSLATANRLAQAREFAHVLTPLIAELPPLNRADSFRVLGQLAQVAGDVAQAEAAFTESVRAYQAAPRSSARASGLARVTVNLQILSFEAHGYVTEPLAALLQLAEEAELPEDARVLARQNAAVYLAYRTEYAAAAEQIRLASKHSPAFTKLYMEIIVAYLELRLSEFPRLLSAARKWERYALADRVSALWLRALRRQGDLQSGLKLRNTLAEGAFTKLELVWVYAHAGDMRTAEALLHEVKGAYELREFTLHWLAASYRLDPQESTLNELLAVMATGAHALAYALVPLAQLPRDRPELALAYSLTEVLQSGWPEAIALRMPELPPLRVELLGGMRVEVLGEEVELTERQKQLVALFAIGYSREQAAEHIWPGVNRDQQRNNLNVQVNLLRKRLEPWGARAYVHKTGLKNFTSDYAGLTAALKQRDASAALAAFAIPVCPPAAGGAHLEVFTELERQLKQQLCELLLSESAIGGEAAVTYLTHVLTLEPLHEEALQQLVRALTELGRAQQAKREYDAFAARLLKEVGEHPLPATRAAVAERS